MSRKCPKCGGINPDLSDTLRISGVVGVKSCDCNPARKWQRAMTVYVTVPESWLTADGEWEASEGWSEVEDDIKRQLKRDRQRSPVVYDMEGWLDGPEEVLS